jgi:molecular chaperone GrpE
MKHEKEQKATMEKDTTNTDNISVESQEPEITTENNTTESAPETPSQPDGYVDYEAQVEEWKDKYIRLSAEFDNYRKRTLKEKADLIRTAGEDVLTSILPVVDDFERGLKNLETAQDMEAVKQGVVLIYNKFRDFLTARNVKEIEAQNLDFNVDEHEAITKIPAPTDELKGKVVDVVQKGYRLGDKIIRFPKVVVGE